MTARAVSRCANAAGRRRARQDLNPEPQHRGGDGTNRMTPDIENGIVELDPNSEGCGFGLTVAVHKWHNDGEWGEFYWSGTHGTLWWADPTEDLGWSS